MKKYVLLVILVIISFVWNAAYAYTESFTVYAGEKKTFTYYLEGGDRLEFWVSASGGRNDDIILRVVDPSNQSLLQGRVYSNFNEEIRAEGSGNYYFTFDNTISLISNKQVSFTYEIIKKPSFQGVYGYDGIIFLLIIISVMIGPVVGILYLIKSRKKATSKTDYDQNDDVNEDANEKAIENEQNSNALSILKERLAKGEITKKDYDELKKEFEK